MPLDPKIINKNLEKLLADKRDLNLKLKPYMLYYIVLAVQLAKRHPHFPDSPTLQQGVTITQLISQPLVLLYPELADFIAAGWDEDYDEMEL